ncbi:MAG: CpaF family protein [Oscillospiraceae bacterium]|nr:CpaF family protein [Oscillospiraceae bacterium]
MIDGGQSDNSGSAARENFEAAKNRSDILQKYRDASDDEFRLYIIDMLNAMLLDNGDYIASDEAPYYISPDDRALIQERVFGTYRGLGLLDTLLMNEEITELMVNGPDHIFVEKRGRVVELEERICNDTDCTEEERRTRGEKQLRKIIRRIVDICGRDISDANPIVDARLKDGSRVNIVLYPIALGGDTVTIRKFSKKPMSVEKLIAYKSITQEIADKLHLLVKAKYNIFISGGTGSGKTTFLNALSNYIPRDERVITIEDSAELQITGVDNLVSLETKQANAEGKGGITIKDLIKSSLRMRPERIVVGEVRGEEALDMLQAMNTGHDGSLSTGHANSAKDMLTRLETMVLQGASGLPLDAVRRQIGSALDIIVHLSRMRDHSRKVVEISEVLGYEHGDIIMNPLYVFEEDENSTLEKVSGGLNRTKNPMKNVEKLRQAGILEDL